MNKFLIDKEGNLTRNPEYKKNAKQSIKDKSGQSFLTDIVVKLIEIQNETLDEDTYKSIEGLIEFVETSIDKYVY